MFRYVYRSQPFSFQLAVREGGIDFRPVHVVVELSWTAASLDSDGEVLSRKFAPRILSETLRYWMDHTVLVEGGSKWWKNSAYKDRVRPVPFLSEAGLVAIVAREGHLVVEKHLEWFPNRPRLEKAALHYFGTENERVEIQRDDGGDWSFVVDLLEEGEGESQ